MQSMLQCSILFRAAPKRALEDPQISMQGDRSEKREHEEVSSIERGMGYGSRLHES